MTKAYEIPDTMLNDFTPQEAEELFEVFSELDADDSGAIDVDELHAAFKKMGEEVTRERVFELIEEVDEDNSGELDFCEFLMLMTKFKQSDSKFSAFFNIVADSPIAMLRREARKRKLKLSFVLDEVRKPTSMHLQHYVISCVLEGEWHEFVGGSLVKAVGKRTFQGIAKSTRDAKHRAAAMALSRLRKHLPGIQYEVGEIPDKWWRWTLENLQRGCDCEEVMRILVRKGFKPCKNTHLMQLVSAKSSLEAVLRNRPHLKVLDDGRQLPPEFLKWAEENLGKGLDGSVVMEVLVLYGFRPQANPYLAQALRKNRGGRAVDPLKPVTFGFIDAVEMMDLEETRR